MNAYENIQFHHINTKGYSIHSMYCDIHGIMWFGTPSGLFNLPQINSRSSISSYPFAADVNKNIISISGDNNGCLWLKNQNNDMLLYNPQVNDSLVDVQKHLLDKGISIYKDFTILANKKGYYWTWKYNKLYLLKNHSEHVNTFTLTSESFRNTCFNDFYLVALSDNKLHFLSFEKQVFERQVDLPDEYKSKEFNSLYIDSNHNVWIWKYNKIHRYNYNTNQWDLCISIDSFINGIEIDHQNYLWINAYNNGIYLYNYEGQFVNHLQHSVLNLNGLQSNRIDFLYYEKTNHTMWIAYTKGGVSVWNAESANYMPVYITNEKTNEAPTDVLSFALPSQKKGIWLGLEDRGVYYLEKNKQEHVVENGSATTLLESSDNTLWIGLYQKGLLRRKIDGTEKLFYKDKSPFAIAEGKDGLIYTALLGNGVWCLNPETGDVTNTNSPFGYVFHLEYHQQKLYAASTEGCYVMSNDGIWHKIYDGYFRNICIDKYNYLWLTGDAGNEGLTVIAPNRQIVEVPEELKYAPLKRMTKDSDENIWVVSSNELYLLQHDQKEVNKLTLKVFDINNKGEGVNYNYQAMVIDDNGYLWIGTTMGYQRIDTHKLLKQSSNTKSNNHLYVGAISINDKLLTPGQEFNGRIVLNKDIVFTRNLNLKYNENNLIIECGQANSIIKTTNVYFYKIKGLSDKWLPIKDGTIVLSNLNPGDYEIMTRTQSSTENLLIFIEIAPPFWLTWWAYLVYLILTIILLHIVYTYYNNKRIYQLQLKELQLQQEQESRINEMKLQFFTNISHDLRTPLSLIIDPIEELLKQVNDPYHSSILKMISRNAEHLHSLVNQILDFRRLEFGREKLLLSYGDIVSLVKDICSSFRIKAEKENVRLFFLPMEERVDTMFDKDKTTKILMNLLSNAFKYTDAGGYIHVQLEVLENNIVITVKDNGVGISEEDKKYIFDRFYQSKTQKRSTIGSGIGLHIVREYVRLQGGEICVKNNPEGHGSIFLFTIPLRKENMILPVSEVIETNDNEIHETTLLIVDDNQDLLNYISLSLSGDYNVVNAQNGKEALEMVLRHDIDLIISDIMMPEMDGFELCRKIKGDIESSHIPIILLTAKSMGSDELTGLEAGADDYITKPFSISILKQRIYNLMERNRLQHQRFATEINIEPSEITVTSLDEKFITQAIAVVEKHFSDTEFGVEEFSNEMGVHRSQLYKKLNHLTGKKPLQFIRLLRLKRGKQLLEQSGMYISEVAYQVGFNSPRIFSKYFKEEFDITPKDFQNKIESEKTKLKM